MKKLTFIAILALVAVAIPVSATTVSFTAASAATQRQAILNDGSTPVPDLSLVVAGVFADVTKFSYNPSASPLTNFNNMLTAGDGGFSEFGLVQPGNGASEASTYTLAIHLGFGAEQVSAQIIDNNGAAASGQDASFFDNKQLYIVIFNGTTVAAASQMGVFTSASWLFKGNTQGTGGDVGTYATSTGTVVTPVNGAGSVNSSPNQLELAAAPEPTTLTTLLGAGGLLALFRRRRSA
jgi:hypothetical protein